jgi:hypothetical protein
MFIKEVFIVLDLNYQRFEQFLASFHQLMKLLKHSKTFLGLVWGKNIHAKHHLSPQGTKNIANKETKSDCRMPLDCP